MAPEPSYEQIWAPYRVELRRDWVSLSEVYRRVKRTVGEQQDVQAVTLELIRWVLGEREAVAGQLVDGDFVVWDEPVAEVVARVGEEWAALGRDPNPGEVVWFSEPPAGAT